MYIGMYQIQKHVFKMKSQEIGYKYTTFFSFGS